MACQLRDAASRATSSALRFKQQRICEVARTWQIQLIPATSIARNGRPRVRTVQGDNTSAPPTSEWKLSPDSKFVHYCDNETIQGVEFKGAPDVGDRLLVGDFSSNILSKPVDVSKYGVIYAGAHRDGGCSERAH